MPGSWVAWHAQFVFAVAGGSRGPVVATIMRAGSGGGGEGGGAVTSPLGGVGVASAGGVACCRRSLSTCIASACSFITRSTSPKGGQH